MYATRALQRGFRATPRMMRPIPVAIQQKEEQSAHGVSQRLRRLKNIPAELIPLGVVVAFAVGAAIYSSARHLIYDPNIKLKRSARKPAAPAGHEEHH